jgi:hypothetical protein
MSSNQPLWLRAVLRAERAVGTRVESAVRTDTYFDAVSRLNRLNGQVNRAAEDVSRRWLHLFNLPAGSDVRRLREQLSRMERRLGVLADDVAELDQGVR